MHSFVMILALLVAAVAAVRGLWSPCGLSMVSALNPLSESARGHRYAGTAGWYVTGAVAGGAALGAACALGAGLVGVLGLRASAVAAIALGAATIAWLSDADRPAWSLPLHPRQVNEEWITTYRRWIYAAGFGAQIGTGFATYIMSASVYLTAALAVLTGSPTAALVVGVAFGLVRGAGILASAGAGTPERLRDLHRRLDRHARTSLAACLAVEILVAGAAAWVLAGPALAGPLAGALVIASVLPRRAHRRVALAR